MGSSFLFNKPILDQEISVGRGLNRYTDVIAAPEMTKFCVFCRKIIINRVHNGEFTSEWWLLPYVLKLMYNIISPLAATIPTYLSLSSSPDPKGPTIWSLPEKSAFYWLFFLTVITCKLHLRIFNLFYLGEWFQSTRKCINIFNLQTHIYQGLICVGNMPSITASKLAEETITKHVSLSYHLENGSLYPDLSSKKKLSSLSNGHYKNSRASSCGYLYKLAEIVNKFQRHDRPSMEDSIWSRKV